MAVGGSKSKVAPARPTELHEATDPLQLPQLKRYPVRVFVRFIFVHCTAVVIGGNFIFGCILGGFENWRAWTGFLYVSSNVCGLGNPLTDASPHTHGGIMVDILTSFWSIGVSGTIMGVVGGLTAATKLVDRFNARDNSKGTVTMLAVFTLLVIPFGCLFISVVCGCVLAIVEGWSWTGGMSYVASNVAGMI
jgi:hypothetical protein